MDDIRPSTSLHTNIYHLFKQINLRQRQLLQTCYLTTRTIYFKSNIWNRASQMAFYFYKHEQKVYIIRPRTLSNVKKRSNINSHNKQKHLTYLNVALINGTLFKKVKNMVRKNAGMNRYINLHTGEHTPFSATVIPSGKQVQL